MNFCSYFVLNINEKGKQYILAEGTEIQFKREFCCRANPFISPNLRSSASAGLPMTSKFSHTYVDSDGKTMWVFNNAMVKDFNWDRDVEKIIKIVPYVPPKTEKEKIQEKFDNGTAMKYIWFDTIVYIMCLMFSLFFYEWYIGWIGGTIIYYFVCKEKLSK